MPHIVSIPATAQWLPLLPFFKPQEAIEDHTRNIAQYNAQAEATWQGMCAIWRAVALYNRDNRLGQPIKPLWRTQYAVHTLGVIAWVQPIAGVVIIQVSVPDTADTLGGIYMWDEELPALQCPDLDPAGPKPAGTMMIGQQNDAYPEWFSALPGDTTKVGTVGFGTSQSGISGLFKKVGAPVGPGYFLKVG